MPANHVALVTGASRGIGRAIARRLAAQGAMVVVTASARSTAGLRETCEMIAEGGGRAAAETVDLGDGSTRANLVADAAKHFGPIDILVNNAAANPAFAPPSKIDRAAREQIFEINFQAPVDLIQDVVSGMRERGWGRIVNISSEMARQPPIPYPGPAKLVHNLSTYGASKAALERYTLGLAAELHGSGITANALAPYRIALTETARDVARQLSQAHPEWIEPVEMMAEATWLLVNSGMNGWIGASRELLQLRQAPLHALDGTTVIGDATTLAKP
jgi:NAD(P)-dependent dehydrogenase (short-subunit alcohol dehydrogenase family)